MIPEAVAYCTRCGSAVNYEERFGRVRPVCPACGWIYFQDPKVAVAVVILSGGRLLLVQRANDPRRGLWTMPGGFVDAGEDPAQAAVRECLEETGLAVRILHLLELASRPADNPGANLILYYAAQVISGEPTAADDAEAVAFFDPAHLPPLAFESPEFLLSLLDGIAGKLQ